jgi:hypothetical protein
MRVSGLMGAHVAFAAPSSCAILPGELAEGGMKMVKAVRQNVTVHYRRLEDVTGAFGKHSLESAIRAAMNHQIRGKKILSHWKQRAWVVPPSSDETLLMNLHHDGGSYYFGDLTQYTVGYLQALLSDVPDAPMLPVEQEPPPKGKEYVHSMMYWLVVKNHLLMVQSRSLGAKHLEDFLTWFLKDRTATVGPPGQVILQAKFDAADVGGDLDDIREIIVGGKNAIIARSSTHEPERVREVEVHRDVAKRKPMKDRMLDVLYAVMNNEADVQKLLDSIPDEANLEVNVHIGYKTKKRHVSRAPMQEALRNLPEGEITAIGRDGRMTGNDIRLSHNVSVLKNGSLLDPQDVQRGLRDAHKYFLDNGKIDA